MEVGEYARMDALEATHPWFVAKRKYIAAVLDRCARRGRVLKVLDVGCGTGAIMELLNSRGYEAHGIDMSDEALAYCRKKGLTVANGLANAIAYPDESFDIVLALDVLEHVDDDRGTVREISRVLKPGGLFICTVPAHQWMWSYHDEALHHKRRYNKRMLHATVTSALDVRFMSWIHAFVFIPAYIMRAVKKRHSGSEQTSDVQEMSPIAAAVLTAVYALEVGWFSLTGWLPFGLSLLAVSEKKR